MTNLLLTGVGADNATSVATSASVYLNYYENFYGHDIDAYNGVSNATLSVHFVNVQRQVQMNNVAVLLSNSTGTVTRSLSFGLYSLFNSELRLANSGSRSVTYGFTALQWITFALSATSVISVGQWYLALNVRTAGNSSVSLAGNSSINFGNAPPRFFRGRMTVSTSVMPGTISTSDLDITGSDAIRQPYILITA